MLSLPVVALAITGCQSLGINESNSFFVGRYTQYVLGNIPDQYADLSNPLPASSENISDGKKLYQAQCTVCHGASGEGNGSAGKLLVPSPANLSITRRLPVATDAFIFWTLSEGGEPFGTAMPAFGNQLTDNEIWQIALYINTGFSL
ncbi:c-type cytochrome [endosymbiont of Lamellibrachia barhami]|uniref:c-type cytochrome n=1 Tax=endosymbiont of Lamellibrachia barhami TaxID=205975 RepID=UPI0015B26FBF|nr:cytochrome c [endosymbiont of Lamellibrachia barhami]